MRKLNLIATAVALAATLITGPAATAEVAPANHAGAFGLSSSSIVTTKVTKSTDTNTAAAAPAATSNPTVTVTEQGVPIERMSTVSDGNFYYDGQAQWAFLQNPKMLIPGGRITTPTGTICSVGYIVNRGAERMVLTAGHCGTNGTDFGIRNSFGRWTKIGTMVDSVDVDGKDWGLIKITNDAYTIDNAPIAIAKGAPMAAADAATADSICILGQTSGLSCGVYKRTTASGRLVIEAVSSNGDSGGTVFALTNGTMRPIGILEGGYGNNELAVQPLDRIQNTAGITINS